MCEKNFTVGKWIANCKDTASIKALYIAYHAYTCFIRSTFRLLLDNAIRITLSLYSLWSPYVIRQTIIFLPCDFYLLSSIFFYSSPNLSGRRLDVYHTSINGVALVRI